MKIYSRKMGLLITDIVLINFAAFMALFFRFDGNIPAQYIKVFADSFVFLTIIKLLLYGAFGLYKSLWRYASIEELVQIFLATLAGSVGAFLFGIIFNMPQPRTVYAISWLLTFICIGGSRISYRLARRAKLYITRDESKIKRILVIGAGEAGSMVIKELKSHPELMSVPVAIADDDLIKQGLRIHGVTVKGNRLKIREIVIKDKIDEIILAIPSATKEQIREILAICAETKCRLKTLPGIYELINNNIDITKIRDVDIEDLLGREEIELNNEEISGYLKDEVILVTGGGGSIGSELCRQVARFGPRKIVVFDIYENSAYDLQLELDHLYKGKLEVEIAIGSVQDRERLSRVFEAHKPGVVFHAAAHKHVPLMEANPTEAIKNNVFGTLNTAECADAYGVKKFVLISTDKAVNPTNIMGATKRVAELIIQNMSKHSNTEFAAVRFGNVLGSNGSVIPIFKKQIARGGPITITHPEINRYFMTIPEAAQLVIQAGAIATGGEIFILDMGEPVKIVDLAKDLIRLSGLKPDIDIPLEYVGLRPGEKLYEELLLAEEGMTATKYSKIFISKPVNVDYKAILREITGLRNKVTEDCDNELGGIIQNMVPTYKPVEIGRVG